MIKLIHSSTPRRIASILKTGLIPNAKKCFATEDIDAVLNHYRPKHFPSFVNRSRCIYFHFAEEHLRAFLHRDSFPTIVDTSFIVDTDVLDLNKLYVADYEPPNSVNDHLAIFDHVFNHTEILDRLANESKTYWNSFIPFLEYMTLPPDKQYKTTELLYFDAIPIRHLTYLKHLQDKIS